MNAIDDERKDLGRVQWLTPQCSKESSHRGHDAEDAEYHRRIRHTLREIKRKWYAQSDFQSDPLRVAELSRFLNILNLPRIGSSRYLKAHRKRCIVFR